MTTLSDQKWPWIEGTHGMRTYLLDTLTDADLAFSPGGQTMTFGALFRELGETEYSYIQSLKTFKQDFLYRNPTAGLDQSVAQLTAWYKELDDDFKATLVALSDDDTKKTIARNSGFQMPMDLQLDAYLQALLIFMGKATIYLRVMEKPLLPSIAEYIG